MNTAVINIKTNAKIKSEAQRIASDLGFSLSSLINGYLKQFVKTKTVHFSLNDETPSDYMIREFKKSEEDRKAGRVSPSFTNAKDAIAWLNDPKAKFLNAD